MGLVWVVMVLLALAVAVSVAVFVAVSVAVFVAVSEGGSSRKEYPEKIWEMKC